MARLYVWVNTDMIRNERTARANETVDVPVNYGSKDDSKPCLRAYVRYDKGSKKPSVRISTWKGVRLFVNGVEQ